MYDMLNLLQRLYQSAHNIAGGTGSALAAAMTMSEIVYEAIDIMQDWTVAQQQQGIVTFQACLQGTAIEGFDRAEPQAVEDIFTPMLRATVATAPKELNLH